MVFEYILPNFPLEKLHQLIFQTQSTVMLNCTIHITNILKLCQPPKKNLSNHFATTLLTVVTSLLPNASSHIDLFPPLKGQPRQLSYLKLSQNLLVELSCEFLPQINLSFWHCPSMYACRDKAFSYSEELKQQKG